jgi:thiamine biosynthesis lipoprotein ApbE
MKQKLSLAILAMVCILFVACGSKKETAKEVAQKWCDLNGKVYKASSDAEKEAAKAAIDKWENEMEAKYKGDEAFMKEVEKEAEKCEGASEGK